MTTDIPHVVTDSTADLPADLARRLDITVIPCQIHFGHKTYREGVDIDRAEFYARLRAGERFTTSQPPVGAFVEVYRRLLEDGRPIVSVHISGALSGVYATAVIGAREVAPDRIAVVDGNQVSMCTGWLAVEAAEAAKAGASLADVMGLAQALLPRLRLLALIDNLQYLQRSGRVSWASSLLGGLLSIKPLLSIRDGHAELLEKVRLRSRGLDRLVALAAELAPVRRLAVLHADAPDVAQVLAARLSHLLAPEDILVAEAGTIISGHAGPGAVGVACLLAGSL
ncbi:MAG: DegV family protein [Anaerolineae bacterium]